jgi:hypothetical protein
MEQVEVVGCPHHVCADGTSDADADPDADALMLMLMLMLMVHGD